MQDFYNEPLEDEISEVNLREQFDKYLYVESISLFESFI